MYFKDRPSLKSAQLRPARTIVAPTPATVLGALAATYNRVGGLIDQLSVESGIDPVAVLAVWYVESGGAAFTAGKSILRFEAHKFYKYWGLNSLAAFDAHFQFGGHNGIVGKSHQNHKVRLTGKGEWQSYHGNQTKEYGVIKLAETLGGAEAAALSASFGGPQIMGFNHRSLGYANAASLRQAFDADERWQVLGFFDFCQSNLLLSLIEKKQWQKFSDRYNGDGATHGSRMRGAYDLKAQLAALPRRPAA